MAAVRRVGLVLGAAFLLLGVVGTSFEGSHGLRAFWEHWWCPTPLVVLVLGVAGLIAAQRTARAA
jgi:hypothetical protein